MKFRGLKKRSFRKNLERRAFYDRVNFETDELKETITEWVFNLWEIKGIKIHKFIDLFTDLYDDVVFPIRIREFRLSEYMTWNEIDKNSLLDGKVKIIVVDREDKEFYMDINRDCSNINKYSVGMRDKNVDRKLKYRILPPSKIILQALEAIGTNKSGINQKIKYSIYYDMEEILAKKRDIKKGGELTIRYKAKSFEKDEEIITILSRTQVDINNVVSLFFKLLEILEDKDDIISIQSNVNGNVYSELLINDGMVLRYSYTEYLVYKNEFCTHRISQPLDLETFISKYKYYV